MPRTRARNWRANLHLQKKKKKMDPEQEVREFQREYLDFLDDEVSVKKILFSLKWNRELQEEEGMYRDKVLEMIKSQHRRLIVNVNDLRRKKAERAVK